MVIDWKMKSTFIQFLFFCVTGCVSSTDIGEIGNSMPGGWSVVSPAEQETCASIDGDYQILGLGKLREGALLEKTRLDVALGHTFPTNGMPDQVSIVIDKEANLLNFRFGYPVNLGYSESISCSDGWYVFEQRRTDQYVGDGTKLDHLIRKIRLGKASDGSLIVHLILEGQFSSFSVLKSHDATETWSKYRISM